MVVGSGEVDLLCRQNETKHGHDRASAGTGSTCNGSLHRPPEGGGGGGGGGGGPPGPPGPPYDLHPATNRSAAKEIPKTAMHRDAGARESALLDRVNTMKPVSFPRELAHAPTHRMNGSTIQRCIGVRKGSSSSSIVPIIEIIST